jgi:hypothetical protein
VTLGSSSTVADQQTAPRRRPWPRWGVALLLGAAFVVPLLYLGVVFRLQADEHLGPRTGYEWSHQRYFDDYDMTAFALRGLNAALGRSAGRTTPVDDYADEDYDRLLKEDRPLQPRYYLEYPHAALWVFRLGWLGQPLPPIPPALLDGSYGDIIWHNPDGPAEADLWRKFRWTTRVYEALMVACLFALVLTLRAGYDRSGALASSGLPLLLLPGALYFTVNRFDILPTLLMALSLFCLGRRWVVASACLLAAGAMVKVFPVLLVPLVLRYLLPDWQRAARWLTAFAATASILVMWPLLREGWQAVWAPYQFQLNREPFGWTAYGYILPLRLADNDLAAKGFRLGALLLTELALCVRPVPDLASLLRRAAVVLIVFVSLAVFYSPQWVVWLLPLLLPLGRRQPALVWLAVALDLVTYLNWPFFGSGNLPWLGSWDEPVLAVLVYARFGILAALAVLLLRGENQSRELQRLENEKTPVAEAPGSEATA